MAHRNLLPVVRDLLTGREIDRRVFLATSSVAAATVCIGASLHGCAGGTSAQPPGRYDSMLRVADIPVGTARAPANTSFIVARDDAGFYAYSNVCTHEGCTLPLPSNGVSQCPCHGARFDSQGDNLAGPNGSGHVADLAHYEVSFVGTGDSAEIWVDTSVQLTDRGTRVAPSALG